MYLRIESPEKSFCVRWCLSLYLNYWCICVLELYVKPFVCDSHSGCQILSIDNKYKYNTALFLNLYLWYHNQTLACRLHCLHGNLAATITTRAKEEEKNVRLFRFINYVY